MANKDASQAEESKEKRAVTIEMKPIEIDNNNKSDEVTDVTSDLMTSKNIKNMELYDEYQEKTLGKFLNNIMNFNSIMPSDKELTDNKNSNDNNKNKLGTLLGVFLPCIQNIFGVILFIRAAWIVGIAGSVEALILIFLCCSCVSLFKITKICQKKFSKN
jgi:hypothetical protein